MTWSVGRQPRGTWLARQSLLGQCLLGQFRLGLGAILLFLCLGCGPKVDNSQVKLPPPRQSTTLGPGDLFTLEVVGEKDLPKEFQVASDGTVDFP